jgi:cell division septation protein DedD
VAAFREVQSAEQLVATLRTKGYPAYQLRTTMPDTGEWFRVRVGAFDNRAAAETMLKKLNGSQVQGMVIGTQ